MSTNLNEVVFTPFSVKSYTLLEYCFKAPSRGVFSHFCTLRLPYGAIIVDALEELGIICLLGILELHATTLHI